MIIYNQMEQLKTDLSTIEWLTTDTNPIEELPIQFSAKNSDIAFLQYTSGSTGQPKGAIITHENIYQMNKQIEKYLQLDSSSVAVNWLIPYHDMGLVGCLLTCIMCGAHSVNFSNFNFLHNPLKWLQLIDQYRGNTAAAPDHSYKLCMKEINPSQLIDLDLSCLTSLVNGSETVEYNTMVQFAKFLEPTGFRLNSFLPCYGMAETNLAISMNNLGTLKHLTISSKDLAKNQAVLSNDENSKCAPFEIGEIWTQGPHVGSGYWQKPDLSKTLF